jgi:hypothetical protein
VVGRFRRAASYGWYSSRANINLDLDHAGKIVGIEFE